MQCGVLKVRVRQREIEGGIVMLQSIASGVLTFVSLHCAAIWFLSRVVARSEFYFSYIPS